MPHVRRLPYPISPHRSRRMLSTNSSISGRCHASLCAGEHHNPKQRLGRATEQAWCSLVRCNCVQPDFQAGWQTKAAGLSGCCTHRCPWMNTVVSASPPSYSSMTYFRYTEASLPLPLAMCGQQDRASMISVLSSAVASAHSRELRVSLGTSGCAGTSEECLAGRMTSTERHEAARCSEAENHDDVFRVGAVAEVRTLAGGPPL